MDLRRFSEKSSKTDLKFISISELLSDVSKNFEDYLNKLNISFELTDTVSEQVLIDEQRLKRTIRTLLLNAIDNTEQGEIKLGASISETEKRKILKVSVVDTGKGMSKSIVDDYLNAKRFSRVHKENIDSRVSISFYYINMICTKFKGRLAIQSREGHGTNVTLLFPVKIK